MGHQFEDIQEAQGWTDETLLQLLLEYITEHYLDDEVDAYLTQKAEEENEG